MRSSEKYQNNQNKGLQFSCIKLEAQLETWDKSTISRSRSILLEHHAIHTFEK